MSFRVNSVRVDPWGWVGATFMLGLSGYAGWRFHQSGLLFFVMLALRDVAAALFFLVRRRGTSGSVFSGSSILAYVSTLVPLCYLPAADDVSGVFGAISSCLAILGFTLATMALFEIGPSFGVAAANRGEVRTGVYGWLKHPMYVGYGIAELGMVLVNPVNAALYAFSVLLYWSRARLERLVFLALNSLSSAPVCVGRRRMVKFAILGFRNIAFFPSTGFQFALGNNEIVHVFSIEKSLAASDNAHWSRWIGEIAWDKFSKSKVQIQAWCESATADVLDAENEQLFQAVDRAYRALLLCDLALPLLDLTGAISGSGHIDENGHLVVDTIKAFQSTAPIADAGYVRIDGYVESKRWLNLVETRYDEEFFLGWKNVTERLKQIEGSKDKYMALNLAIYSFQSGLREPFADFAFPCFIRAIESLVPLSVEQGRGVFARRAIRYAPKSEHLCIDVSEKDLLKILKRGYGLRSDVMHGKSLAHSLGSKGAAYVSGPEVRRDRYFIEATARSVIRQVLLDEDYSRKATDRRALENHWNTIDPVIIDRCLACGAPIRSGGKCNLEPSEAGDS